MTDNLGKTIQNVYFRIWEKDGQEKLEQANLLFLGNNLTISEIIKNLVLPGIND